MKVKGVGMREEGDMGENNAKSKRQFEYILHIWCV